MDNREVDYILIYYHNQMKHEISKLWFTKAIKPRNFRYKFNNECTKPLHWKLYNIAKGNGDKIQLQIGRPNTVMSVFPSLIYIHSLQSLSCCNRFFDRYWLSCF